MIIIKFLCLEKSCKNVLLMVLNEKNSSNIFAQLFYVLVWFYRRIYMTKFDYFNKKQSYFNDNMIYNNTNKQST